MVTELWLSLTLIFNKLRVPLSPSKTVGPTTVLEYLGVILDSDKLEARLPRDKVERMISFILSVLQKRSCTKRELLQLLGHFNFASRVILPGRSFVSYLILLSTTVSELHHYVHLTVGCKEDLKLWLRFLENWNGVPCFTRTCTCRPRHATLYRRQLNLGFLSCVPK